MTPDHVVALAAFSMSITILPGPNNALLMSSGLTHGFARTLPAILGLCLGFAGMMVAITLGLAALFEAFPAIYTLLKVLSVVYLLYLAWRVAQAAPRSGEVASRPMSFAQGMGVICLNPQGWVFASSMVTAFLVRSEPLASLIVLTSVCTTARFAGACLWTLSGASLRQLLRSPTAVRRFNLAMALLMVASLWPAVSDLVRVALR